MRQAHTWLIEIAHCLKPETGPAPELARSGAQVRAEVEVCLQHLATAVASGLVAEWLHAPLTHLGTVLLRLGSGLYHCYDVPGLPRTNNDLEQFYRRVKAGQRRITGHKRSDEFIVRVGGFAVYAVAASDTAEAELQRRLAGVAASAWQGERVRLREQQERQTKMRRFHLHRAAYLAHLEARWTRLAEPP